MNNKRLEQIARLVVDCEGRAESQQEYELLHQIYLDVQNHYKEANGRYMKIREHKAQHYAELEKRLEGELK